MRKQWKKIKDYPSYEVSDHGEVRRLTSSCNFNPVGKNLKGTGDHKGYLYLSLFNRKTRKHKKINLLVAEAFIGVKPKGLQVNHIDGAKANNHYKNLEYVTASENRKHAFKLGLSSHKGEGHPASKLTNKDVLEIRRIYSKGDIRKVDISKLFNISQSTVGRVISRKVWAHI